MNAIQCDRCKHWYHPQDIAHSLGVRKKLSGTLCKPCWVAATKESATAANKRRSIARKARIEANGGHHTKADIELQLKSQKYCCWWCGKSLVGQPHQKDHRIPLTRGGSDNPENICVTCVPCNSFKADKLPQEWIGRLL